MSKHTPGPWIYEGRPTGYNASISLSIIIGDTIITLPNTDEHAHDAELIARAPEMGAEIELLKAERDHYEKFYNEYHNELPKMSAELGDNKRLRTELDTANARIKELEVENKELKTMFNLGQSL